VKKLLVVLSLLLLGVALISHLSTIGLRAEEPKRAILGMETYLSVNFIVPQIHGEPYFDKPPLYNWVLFSFFWIFNSFDEWVVRLPGILSILLTALFTFLAVRKYSGTETAWVTSMAYITSADLFFYGSVNAGEIDLFYSFIVVVQVLSIFWYFEKGNYLAMFLISWLFAAIGFLTKGIPSVAFQVLTLLVVLIYFRNWKLLFSWKHFVGIFLFLVIAGGYFWAYSRQGDAIGYLISISKQSSQRSFNEYPVWEIAQQLFVFPLQLIKLMAPWSILLVFFFRKGFFKTLKQNKFVLFSWLFVIVNIPIYWLSPEMRDRYLYMFLPFLAAIFIYFFQTFRNTTPSVEKWIRLIFGGMMVLTILFFIAFPLLGSLNREVEKPILIAVVFSILGGAVLWFYWKFPKNFIYSFILFLIIGRIWFNFALLPHLHASSRTSEYAFHAEKILEITGHQPVFYTGYPLTYHPDLSLFGTQLYRADITIPPLTAFQIPYYLVRSNGHIMQYEQEPKPGKFYLSYENFVNEYNSEKFYTFDERLINQKMVLFKLKENQE
jgi:4-amino-4-deoxy-L-arabinose transferase-like glycosyltransferase